MNGRLGTVNDRLESVNGGLESVNGGLGGVHGRLDGVNGRLGCVNGGLGGLLLENHAVAAMLAQEADVDPQRPDAVVAVGDADEGGVEIGWAAIAHQVHGVRLVVDVHRRPTPGGGAVAVHKFPLRRLGVREGVQAELVAEAQRGGPAKRGQGLG